MGSAAFVFSAPAPVPAQARTATPDWRAPVAGSLTRSFDFGSDIFASGAHRGIDLAARPGARVGATCPGRVAFAGGVARSRVVTVVCGSWRVTHLPLRRVEVSAGERVRRGATLGTVAAGGRHAGLHVGVRRAGSRFGYVDPWPLLARSTGDSPVPGPLPRAPRGVRRPITPTLRVPGSRRRPAPLGRPHAADPRLRGPLASGTARRSPDPVAGDGRPARLAPPLAWAGVALLLLAATQVGQRRRRTPIRLHAKEPATRPR